MKKLFWLVAVAAVVAPGLARAQGNNFVGAVGGFAILSGDGKSNISASSTAVSLYKPETGPAFNVFVGRHLNDWFSLQANYMYNANDLTFTSATVVDGTQATYEQSRSSTQHAFMADLLLYFRGRQSRIRPYLSTGPGFVRLESKPSATLTLIGPTVAPGEFTSTVFGLRVAVGTDLAMGRGWWFRYSFSETIGPNPISDRLTPPGGRALKNFQNLFGVVKTF